MEMYKDGPDKKQHKAWATVGAFILMIVLAVVIKIGILLIIALVSTGILHGLTLVLAKTFTKTMNNLKKISGVAIAGSFLGSVAAWTYKEGWDAGTLPWLWEKNPLTGFSIDDLMASTLGAGTATLIALAGWYLTFIHPFWIFIRFNQWINPEIEYYSENFTTEEHDDIEENTEEE